MIRVRYHMLPVGLSKKNERFRTNVVRHFFTRLYFPVQISAGNSKNQLTGLRIAMLPETEFNTPKPKHRKVCRAPNEKKEDLIESTQNSHLLMRMEKKVSVLFSIE